MWVEDIWNFTAALDPKATTKDTLQRDHKPTTTRDIWWTLWLQASTRRSLNKKLHKTQRTRGRNKTLDFFFTNGNTRRRPIIAFMVFIHFWANNEPFLSIPHEACVQNWSLNMHPRIFIPALVLFVQKIGPHFKSIYLTCNGTLHFLWTLHYLEFFYDFYVEWI